MASLKDRIVGEPIHGRVLSLMSYPAGDGEIVVEGSLKDDIEGLAYLVNSCRLWRENGPLLGEIKAAVEKQKKQEPA